MLYREILRLSFFLFSLFEVSETFLFVIYIYIYIYIYCVCIILTVLMGVGDYFYHSYEYGNVHFLFR